MANIPISFSVSIPKELEASDFDRKVVMDALSKVGKEICLFSRRKLSKKTVSEAGTYPGKRTGRMQRAIKIHKSKRKDKYWIRVQIDSFKDHHMWYPGPLMYGRKDKTLMPRKDAIADSGDELSNKTTRAISDALDKALKGWGG